ncbi:uncharacterized protein LTR77_002631 [Saxophila tyrrhenica]|uniref:Early meiotic induction protein 1 n=1 Tax=Saxophila tyrrhenica TaxID=1690608 RepID=A0AAV9PFT4_9PEZI|nr:hypothetical protein LTR77_002631 [Saxophila tyrrhenica]
MSAIHRLNRESGIAWLLSWEKTGVGGVHVRSKALLVISTSRDFRELVFVQSNSISLGVASSASLSIAMGWLWSSSTTGDGQRSSDGRADGDKPRGFGLNEEQRTRIFGLASADKTRDAAAEKELATFLNSVSEPDASESKAATPAANPSHETSPPEQPPHDRILPDGSLNISPSALYPRTMSCRQAFDQAFYCQSLGGKFNDIYRYGHLQDCSEQWGAFWFCMRTRTLSGPEKEMQIREHYKQRDERKRGEFGSSEDVWEIREKPVLKAFWRDPDAED